MKSDKYFIDNNMISYIDEMIYDQVWAPLDTVCNLVNKQYQEILELKQKMKHLESEYKARLNTLAEDRDKIGIVQLVKAKNNLINFIRKHNGLVYGFIAESTMAEFVNESIDKQINEISEGKDEQGRR